MPDVRNEIVDNLQIRGAVSGGGLGSLAKAVCVSMTAAASGSNGITVADDDDIDFGTGDFFLHWEGSLPDWTPSASVRLWDKLQDANNYIRLFLLSTGILSVESVMASSTIMGAAVRASVATGLADGSIAKITACVVRETASTAGSVTYYLNGTQLGTIPAITAAATVSVSNSASAYICGTSSIRYASNTISCIVGNRALTAAEVLSLYNNGPALADLGASQSSAVSGNVLNGTSSRAFSTFSSTTNSFSGVSGSADSSLNQAGFALTFSSGQRYRVKANYTLTGTLGAASLRVLLTTSLSDTTGASNSETFTAASGSIDVVLTAASSLSGIVAFAFGVSPTTDVTVSVTDIEIIRLGITGWWDARDAQSDTGQIFDSSGNKNHAMLPASGATVIGKPLSEARQVRWTNTWTGTQELQYIGGVNQAVLPAKAYIESIVGIVSGATVEDIIIGDGSSGNRYVTITTGLAAGTVTFTLANRTTDGTNLKLTVDPDANATMSIIWTVTYRILE